MLSKVRGIMKVETSSYEAGTGWVSQRADGPLADVGLVLYFASREVLADEAPIAALAERYPGAALVGCSTGGEIVGREASEGGAVAMAIHLRQSTIEIARRTIESSAESERVGRELGESLAREDLRLVFVLSDGMRVNGSELVRGLRAKLPAKVVVSGGLAGDGARFEKTFVGVGARPEPGLVVAIGFYGESLRIGTGSVGGWEAFGLQRTVTKSEGNVLRELDGEPALDLYKRYLGAEVERLPGSALLFPLALRREGGKGVEVVRTVLTIDEAAKTMTFAGDVPEGSAARLMRASMLDLVDGAERAADAAKAIHGEAEGESLALLVSCIGRRLLMGQRSSDEVEVVADALGEGVAVAGFYSYGELSPHPDTGVCELHNQTMTITTVSEAA